MAGARKFERTGSGPLFWVLLALVVFVLYSASVAALTADACGARADKTWEVLPPGWKCTSRLPGYG